MPRMEFVRQVAADPAGVVLLLSGPAASDLWPDGGVQFGAPGRSGVGFAVDLCAADLCAGEGERPARGRVNVAPDGDGPGTTEVRLVLTAGAVSLGQLVPAANAFLDRLADLAHARSSAA